MILLAILVVVGVVYAAVSFQLGKAFEENAAKEVQSLNLAFSQNLGQFSHQKLFQIQQTDFQNHIFSSQAQYIVHLGGMQTIKLNAKTKHGPLINLQPMRYLTVYELEKDANTAKLFQAAGDKSPVKVTVKTGFGDNSDIRTEILPLRYDKTASFIFSGLDSLIQTNQQKSFIKGQWKSDGFKIFGLGAEFLMSGLKGNINLKENNGLYIGDNNYSISNIKIDGGEIAKMMTVNPTASIDHISYSSKSNKIGGDYQTTIAFAMNNAQVAGFHFGNLKSNIQVDKLPVDMIQQISQMRYSQLSQNEKEKLWLNVLKTNPQFKINIQWENNGQIATALFDLEAKMPKKSFKQADPQDFLFRAAVNMDIPKDMIQQALSQSLMIANHSQADANHKTTQFLNRLVANSDGLVVEDNQSYKTNIVFDNNRLVVNGREQNFNDLDTTLPETLSLPDETQPPIDEAPTQPETLPNSVNPLENLL